MGKGLTICAMVVLVLVAVNTARAGPYAASASEQNDVTVSGSWTSVGHYLSDQCDSWVGNPALWDLDSQVEGSSPVDLSTNISDSYGSASTSITVNVPGGVPTISIDSDAEVHDVQPGPGGTFNEHWAMGYSNGGANWMQSTANQTVDFTVDYSYVLDLLDAAPHQATAEVRICVGFWDASHVLGLSADSEWQFVEDGDSDHLCKTVTLTSIGSSVTSGALSKTWQVSVTENAWHSFWSHGEAYAHTAAIPEPATMLLAGAGLLALLFRRKR